jgi:hypothetical protein
MHLCVSAASAAATPCCCCCCHTLLLLLLLSPLLLLHLLQVRQLFSELVVPFVLAHEAAAGAMLGDGWRRLTPEDAADRLWPVRASSDRDDSSIRARRVAPDTHRMCDPMAPAALRCVPCRSR